MKTLTPYVVGFLLLIAAALFLGNMDLITPAVVEARSETSTGVVQLDVLSDAFALLFHITTGGIIATALGWLMINGGKFYRRWWSQKLTRRGAWRSGPNANFQQQAKLPKLTREDLMLMSLMNQRPGFSGQQSVLRPRRGEEARDDEIDLDL